MDPVLDALGSAARGELMPRGAAVLLAVSGGADSMALLHGAAELASAAEWHLGVAHVHHGWRRREADRDLQFVREHSGRLHLPFFWRRRDARAEARALKLSPEAGARHVRYEALAEMAREFGASRIATAHQWDDRVESHLLARARGVSGPSLAGPRPMRSDGVVRPLLEVTRGAILAFLEARGVAFRRDSSNGDLRLARNRIRREIARRTRSGGREALGELEREVRRMSAERERIEREFRSSVLPSIRAGPGAVLLDATLISACSPDLQRRAIDEAASPFAGPGRAPVSGREAEQILQRLAAGGDFRFEAGRRIRFERRGRLLRVAAAPGRNALRRSAGNISPAESVILEAANEKESSL
jgi:tRNA(Ile)-lysidine synthase